MPRTPWQSAHESWRAHSDQLHPTAPSCDQLHPAAPFGCERSATMKLNVHCLTDLSTCGIRCSRCSTRQIRWPAEPAKLCSTNCWLHGIARLRTDFESTPVSDRRDQQIWHSKSRLRQVVPTNSCTSQLLNLAGFHQHVLALLRQPARQGLSRTHLTNAKGVGILPTCPFHHHSTEAKPPACASHARRPQQRSIAERCFISTNPRPRSLGAWTHPVCVQKVQAAQKDRHR